MEAVLVNTFSVIAGSAIGLVFKKRISDSLKNIVTISAGLVTLILAIDMAATEANVIIVLFSLILGGLAGHKIRIEERILEIGKEKNGSLSGFLNSSLLFCSGAMSIVGSFNAALYSDNSLIYTKSVMDGFMAIVLASIYGRSVMLSALTVLVYQGLLTIFASLLQPLLGEAGVAAMTCTGGFLLIMIALNLLSLKDIKTGNFLPSLIIAPVLSIALLPV